MRETDEPLLLREVHETYEERSAEPRTRQQVSNYLAKLDEYDLAERADAGWVPVDETLAAPGREQGLLRATI